MKVSIITATYNSAETINECLESLKNQTYRNIEHIIIDGKSTDNTVEICKSYSSSVDYEVKIISEPDRGIYDALNKGILMSSGDIIGILHSDDLFAYENVLEDVVEVFKREKVDSCYGDLCYVLKNDTSKVVRYWKSGNFDLKKFRFGWMPPHPTFFVKKEIYEKYGLFNLSYKIAADYELMLRFLYKHKISTFYIQKVLVKMKIGGTSNKSLKNIFQANLECYKSWKDNNLEASILLPIIKPVSKVIQFLRKG
jgi:glycosyltransferase